MIKKLIGFACGGKKLVMLYREWLRPGEEDLVQRFDPSSPLDTIGFFVAKFSVGPKDLSVEENT